jgi:hypothetical protein
MLNIAAAAAMAAKRAQARVASGQTLGAPVKAAPAAAAVPNFAATLKPAALRQASVAKPQ